jgi:peptidoglycan-associated lipoprotein
MNISLTKVGLPVICLALFLAGCAETPIDETSSSIEDTRVQTASVEVLTEPVIEIVEEVEEPTNSAATTFYFEFDKAVLTSQTRVELVEHAQFMMNYPSNIRLEGHADERGTREYNMALAERRANSVKEFMVLQGVPSRLIEVISYGEERAASFGSNAAAWSMNRRVELK